MIIHVNTEQFTAVQQTAAVACGVYEVYDSEKCKECVLKKLIDSLRINSSVGMPKLKELSEDARRNYI
jgi:hypothetical protein